MGEGKQSAMSGIRLTTQLRELERASPILLLKAMDEPQNLKPLPDQTLGGGLFNGGFGGVFPAVTLPAVSFLDGSTTFTILFNRTTHLPAAVRTLDDDPLFGDSNYDLVLSDWRLMGPVKVAHSLVFMINNIRVTTIAYVEVTANSSVSPETFLIPAAVRLMRKPPTPGIVPYQWVIRRLNFNALPDSDGVNFPPGGSLKLIQLSPNVQHVVGGTHNGMILAMKDYLVIFDAPINEYQSSFTIKAAKEKYPGRPIKYLVLTHHHNDHSGGARAYVAEGATIIVPSPNKAFFENVFKAPHTIVPDELARNQRPATVIEVADQMTLRDEVEEIRFYNISSPHVGFFLTSYLLKEDLIWVTDLYNPVRDSVKTPAAVSFYDTLKTLGIRPARLAGGHGGVASYGDFESVEKD
jgi:glyoxylase-like metal-dependent hydrolase (beta-lactamase superfamily II)